MAQPKDLLEAFELFNQASAELSAAYAALQDQVARLNDELAEANLRLRQQLQEKEQLSQRLNLLLNLLPGAVLVLDAADRVQDLNPEARRIFGSQPVPGDDWAELAARRLETLEQGEWLLRPVSPGGLDKRLNISYNRLPDDNGQILLVQDVTESQALRDARQRQQRLSAMGEMLANLAHQLRTPLSAALLYASQLQSPALDASGRERFTGKTVARLRQLETLINDMLRFVKGPSETAGNCMLDQLLAELDALFQPLFAAGGLHLLLENSAGDAQLKGGRELLVSVIGNLLQNALQFSPPAGYVWLAARRVGAAVEITVRDQGPGIAPSKQARLFEPFYTTRAEGTGLGLAVLREVIEELGGMVWVNSREGAGAAFGVRIPLAAGPALQSGEGGQEHD